MERAREQLLARSRLSLEEHGGRVRAAIEIVWSTFRSSALSPMISRSWRNSVTSRRRFIVFAAQPRVRERLGHRELELLALERLLQVLDRAGLDRRHRVIDARVAGEHDHRNVVSLAAKEREELEPGDPRHLVVRDDQVDATLRDPSNAAGTPGAMIGVCPARLSVPSRAEQTAGSSSTQRIVAIEPG